MVSAKKNIEATQKNSIRAKDSSSPSFQISSVVATGNAMMEQPVAISATSVRENLVRSFTRGSGPENRQSKAYRRLFETCRLVKESAPEPGKIIGPTVRILEVPKA